MTTPSISGTFLSRPEGGQEYGVDTGAPGLLGAPVFAPLSGTVVGYSPSSGGSPGWDPGRLLIQTAQGLVGIGHVLSGVKPGTAVSAGQQIGTIGDSSHYGGTPQGNAHIEVMLSPSGANTYSGFTAQGQGSAIQNIRVVADELLASAALSPGGQAASQLPAATGAAQATANGPAYTGSSTFGPGNGWSVGPFQVLSGSALHRVGWSLAGLGLIGFGLVIMFRKEATSVVGATVTKVVPG